MPQFGVTLLTIVAILMMAHGVVAKRGCSAFGHSCFGGHGKRSGDTAMNDVSNQDMLGHHQLGQEEIPPHPEYPQSSYNGLRLVGDDVIPVRDGGAYEHEGNGPKDAMKFKLRNIVKHWIDNYRRSQLNNDDAYFMDSV